MTKPIQKKYLKTPQHFRQAIAEQINLLRRTQANLKGLKDKEKIIKYRIEISRAIAYLSSVGLTAIREGELEDRLKELEEMLENEQVTETQTS